MFVEEEDDEFVGDVDEAVGVGRGSEVDKIAFDDDEGRPLALIEPSELVELDLFAESKDAAMFLAYLSLFN